jgi:hypothetical protein
MFHLIILSIALAASGSLASEMYRFSLDTRRSLPGVLDLELFWRTSTLSSLDHANSCVYGSTQVLILAHVDSIASSDLRNILLE